MQTNQRRTMVAVVLFSGLSLATTALGQTPEVHSLTAGQSATKYLTDQTVQDARSHTMAVQIEADHQWTLAELRMNEQEALAEIRRAQQVKAPTSPFIFTRPAHFPLIGYTLDGLPIARRGVVIYEDMKLVFDRSGNYELRFRISTPAMPVRLHLQLILDPPHPTHRDTITLPPLDFPPRKDRTGSLHGLEIPYVHRGHSESLRRHYGFIGHGIQIHRRGTARIGG